MILDVVYNHTAEGNHLGPTLSFRGIDNAAYYRLVADDPRYYMDYTGTGNSLNMRHPHVLQLIMDCLRYWVQRDARRRLPLRPRRRRWPASCTTSTGCRRFFDLIQQDPVVSQVKLIAEPWDVGEGGYQVGNFPPLWSEWNGKYRDAVRDFWRGDDRRLAEFGYRLTGSSDLYEDERRARPHASINFVTAHDGFTLRDLVSYNDKHNEANGEDNRDGERRQPLVELRRRGPDRRPGRRSRCARRQQRNFLATLLLSQGVPMLLGGDEIGRTQQRQQQRLLPGQRDLLVRLGRTPTPTCSSSPGGLIALRRRPPGVPPPQLVPGRARSTGERRRRHRLVHPRRRRDDRATTGASASPGRSASSSTARPSAPPATGASGSSTTASTPCSTPTRSRSTSCCPTAPTPSAGSVVLDTAPGDVDAAFPAEGPGGRRQGSRHRAGPQRGGPAGHRLARLTALRWVVGPQPVKMWTRTYSETRVTATGTSICGRRVTG